MAAVSFALLAFTVAGASGVRGSVQGFHDPLRIGVSGLNPEGLVIFLSMLHQFARSAYAWPLPAQFENPPW